MSKREISPASASIWSQKPWWCQPWSILLTGVSAIAGSWVLFHSLWLSVPTSIGVGIWWLLFLVLVPAAYANAVSTPSHSSPGGDSASINKDGA